MNIYICIYIYILIRVYIYYWYMLLVSVFCKNSSSDEKHYFYYFRGLKFLFWKNRGSDEKIFFTKWLTNLWIWHLYNVFRSAKPIQIQPINPNLINQWRIAKQIRIWFEFSLIFYIYVQSNSTPCTNQFLALQWKQMVKLWEQVQSQKKNHSGKRRHLSLCLIQMPCLQWQCTIIHLIQMMPVHPLQIKLLTMLSVRVFIIFFFDQYNIHVKLVNGLFSFFLFFCSSSYTNTGTCQIHVCDFLGGAGTFKVWINLFVFDHHQIYVESISCLT